MKARLALTLAALSLTLFSPTQATFHYSYSEAVFGNLCLPDPEAIDTKYSLTLSVDFTIEEDDVEQLEGDRWVYGVRHNASHAYLHLGDITEEAHVEGGKNLTRVLLPRDAEEKVVLESHPRMNRLRLATWDWDSGAIHTANHLGNQSHLFQMGLTYLALAEYSEGTESVNTGMVESADLLPHLGGGISLTQLMHLVLADAGVESDGLEITLLNRKDTAHAEAEYDRLWIAHTCDFLLKKAEHQSITTLTYKKYLKDADPE